MDEHTPPVKPRRLLYACIAGTVMLLALAGWLLTWQLNHQDSLLPAGALRQVTSFTPYFYRGVIPAGYTFSADRITFDDNILIIPLTKAGSAQIVMTEQQLSASLSDEAIQQNSESVASSVGKAAINTIEGRLVGTLIVRDRKTLIIFNAPSEASKDDIRVLLQGLTPAR